MQRSCTLELHSISGRDRIGGIKDDTSFTDGSWRYIRTRLVEAHGCSGAGAGRNIENGESRFFDRRLELGKRAHCQGRAELAAGVCQAILERAVDDEELGLSSKEWFEVLRFGDEIWR
jgi:hypothetical protein